MRESWEEYWLKQARLVATRSTCLRRKIGAVAVRDKRSLATGYNGEPPDIAHCADTGGCMRERLNISSGEQQQLCKAIHAEQNLIIQAAITGVSIKGCDIYITHSPCIICAKMLIGIKPARLIYAKGYPDVDAINLLGEVGIVNFGTFTEWRFSWKLQEEICECR